MPSFTKIVHLLQRSVGSHSTPQYQLDNIMGLWDFKTVATAVLIGFVGCVHFASFAAALGKEYGGAPTIVRVVLSNLDNTTCTGPDPFPNPDNPAQFYQCFQLPDASWVIILLQCSNDGIFEPISGSCVWVQGKDTTVDTELYISEATEPSTTESPTTESPTTEPPTSEPPTTEPPTSEPSTTEPPTTEPPTTEPPTTEPPTTEPSTSTTPATTTTALVPSTTSPTFNCSESGIFPYPPDPTKYYRCILIQGTFYYYLYSCPVNNCYDEDSQLCVLGTCPAATTTTEPATTTSPPVICTQEGTFPDPDDCTIYFRCILIGSQWYQYIFACPTATYYDPTTLKCTPGTCPADNSTTTTITTISTTTPPPVETTAGTPAFECVVEGNFENPANCTTYYKCLLVSGTLQKYLYSCPSGSYFDAVNARCTIGTCPDTTSTTTVSSSSTTALVPTTTLPPNLPTCSGPGIHADPSDCAGYFRCIQVEGNWYIYMYKCAPGSFFAPTVPGCMIGSCDTPSATTATPTTLNTDEGTESTTETITTETSTTDSETATPSDSSVTTEDGTTPDSSGTTEDGTTPDSSSTLEASDASTLGASLSTDPFTEDLEEVIPTTNPAPFVCTSQGIFPDPSNCSGYIRCILIGSSFYSYIYSCPPNMHYDLVQQVCVPGQC